MYPNAAIRGSAPITPGFAGIRLLQYAQLKKAEGKPMLRALKNDILSVSYGLFLQGRTPALPLLLQSYKDKYKQYLLLMQEVDKQEIE